MAKTSWDGHKGEPKQTKERKGLLKDTRNGPARGVKADSVVAKEKQKAGNVVFSNRQPKLSALLRNQAKFAGTDAAANTAVKAPFAQKYMRGYNKALHGTAAARDGGKAALNKGAKGGEAKTPT